MWFPTVSILFFGICILFESGPSQKFAKLSKILNKIWKFCRRISVDQIQESMRWRGWQQRHSLSVCIWFQDPGNLRPFLPCPWHPHPHLSTYNYFSIVVLSIFFVSTIHQDILPSRGYWDSLLGTARQAQQSCLEVTQAEHNRCDSTDNPWAFVCGSTGRTSAIFRPESTVPMHPHPRRLILDFRAIIEVAPHFFDSAIRQVIWPSATTLPVPSLGPWETFAQGEGILDSRKVGAFFRASRCGAISRSHFHKSGVSNRTMFCQCSVFFGTKPKFSSLKLNWSSRGNFELISARGSDGVPKPGAVRRLCARNRQEHPTKRPGEAMPFGREGCWKNGSQTWNQRRHFDTRNGGL